MKFRNIVFLVIIIILAIAGITKPTYADFAKFRQTNDAGIGSPPVIEYVNGFVYSVYTVSYFEVKEVDKTSGSEKDAIAVPLKKERYLGLFGKFWSLD